jgi:hypothetical protein
MLRVAEPLYIKAKKTKLSDENLPYFRFSLRPIKSVADAFLGQCPMMNVNKKDSSAIREAVDCILANAHQENNLRVKNFSRTSKDTEGFAKTSFLRTLDHFESRGLLSREGKGVTRSIITFAPEIREHEPTGVVEWPESAVIYNKKGEGDKFSNALKRCETEIGRRLEAIWQFYLEHRIETGLTKEEFEIFNAAQLVQGKQKLIVPDPAKILPYFVFNDEDLTMGGRMYGAFWIGMKQMLRRSIKIDGELTTDIDGKGMHVQLLYRQANREMPPGDPYVYSDPKERKVAKKAMLLMMNTKCEMSPERGRDAVIATFKKSFKQDFETKLGGDKKRLLEVIQSLEHHHMGIRDSFYRPNWGALQRTEGMIMLKIMEEGMRDGIVILPVHDGCLCQRQHKDRVMQYFAEMKIEAAVNPKHERELGIEETRRLVEAYQDYVAANE